ncbi:hypothetical protein JVT61DRAFT_4166 [Boletus reticuloceps]|uniref:N-acetyltransferase domain-containing protein n=1 Tax=Boletus reticuloceps TaxID=495285 RepID=A0A8I2YPE1_9AGAM|nr:hypothetical protein JVT61DRAFT_4166 [Boletus reticuloceps]
MSWTPDDDDDDDDKAYTEAKPRRAKRRKTNTSKATATDAVANRVARASTSLTSLLDVFQHGLTTRASQETGDDGNDGSKNEGENEKGDQNQNQNQNENDGFESTMEGLLPEYLEVRQVLWAQSSGVALPDDNKGVDGGEGERELVRPLSRFELTRIVALVKQRKARHVASPSEWIALRKLQLQQERRRAGIRESSSVDIGTPTTLTVLDVPHTVPIPYVVFEGLRAIQTTRHEHSFAARVYGHTPQKTPGLIAVDWESRPPWTVLMDDIHAHYELAHPDRDQPERPCIPITYVSLRPSHLHQVHDLLARVFWDGIDVSDALHYTPERCTVIAMYGHLVVGAAFLSSPQETYITYLAVRAGWENAQIATTMLYHLIALHPHRDITLHVSANNPAMLLYNRFGFKAEEFIAGFYEAYLDTNSRASKNAFRLRLRR